jgi:hypothetical protein
MWQFKETGLSEYGLAEMTSRRESAGMSLVALDVSG